MAGEEFAVDQRSEDNERESAGARNRQAMSHLGFIRGDVEDAALHFVGNDLTRRRNRRPWIAQEAILH